jgi:arsenite oxidase small subunit
MIPNDENIALFPGMGYDHGNMEMSRKRRIPGEERMTSCNRLITLGRRQFFKGGATMAAATVSAGTIPAEPAGAATALARVTYPSHRLANLNDLRVDQPVEIYYPDNASPGVLLKVGKSVEGGVGPDRDIVAFSTVCPHQGFPLNYVVADKTLNCPGHYSRFDCEKGGQEIWGHATQNLAQFQLRVDGKGDVYAVAVDELIYGRLSNVLKA